MDLTGAARCKRPARSTTASRGSQYTSVGFTRRLASEGHLGSTGSVGDALDGEMCESLSGAMKIEKLDRQPGYPALTSALGRVRVEPGCLDVACYRFPL